MYHASEPLRLGSSGKGLGGSPNRDKNLPIKREKKCTMPLEIFNFMSSQTRFKLSR